MNEAHLETISNILDDIMSINSDILVNLNQSRYKLFDLGKSLAPSDLPKPDTIVEKLRFIREQSQDIRANSVSVLEVL